MMEQEDYDEDLNQYLRHSSPERESLYEMLEAYWGEGDGDKPPEFIQKAAKLCGYVLKDTD